MAVEVMKETSLRYKLGSWNNADIMPLTEVGADQVGCMVIVEEYATL
jgi:hypothetical protein